MKRFTPDDWTEVIVPTLERELGKAQAAKVLALVEGEPTTGLRVRALIRTHRPAVLQALDTALKEIAAR